MGLNLNDLRWQAGQGALCGRVGTGVRARRPHHHRHLVPEARVRCTEDTDAHAKQLDFNQVPLAADFLAEYHKNQPAHKQAPLDSHLS